MRGPTLALPKIGLWNRIPLVVRAAIVGFAVAGVGVQSWNLLAMIALKRGVAWIPLLVAPALLCLYWLFFSGRLFWHATMAVRRENFRDTIYRRQPGPGAWPGSAVRGRLSIGSLYGLPAVLLSG